MLIEILLVGKLALIAFGGLGDATGRHGSFVLSALIGFLGTISLDLFILAGFGVNNAPPAMFIIPLRHDSNAPYDVWSSELLLTKMRETATSLMLSLSGGLPLGGVIVLYLVGTLGLASGTLTAAIGFTLMMILRRKLPEVRGKEIKAIEQGDVPQRSYERMLQACYHRDLSQSLPA
jgi:hypothetical protein